MNARRAPLWGAWVNEQLAAHGWRPVDLVRNSPRRTDGRSLIIASRVTHWLNGDSRPSYALVLAAADAFGRPRSEALAAAGYDAHEPPTVVAMPTRARPVGPDLDAMIQRRVDLIATLTDEIRELSELARHAGGAA